MRFIKILKQAVVGCTLVTTLLMFNPNTGKTQEIVVLTKNNDQVSLIVQDRGDGRAGDEEQNSTHALNLLSGLGYKSNVNTNLSDHTRFYKKSEFEDRPADFNLDGLSLIEDTVDRSNNSSALGY